MSPQFITSLQLRPRSSSEELEDELLLDELELLGGVSETVPPDVGDGLELELDESKLELDGISENILSDIVVELRLELEKLELASLKLELLLLGGLQHLLGQASLALLDDAGSNGQGVSQVLIVPFKHLT